VGVEGLAERPLGRAVLPGALGGVVAAAIAEDRAGGGVPGDVAAALAYDGVQVLAEGLRRANSLQPDRLTAALTAALADPEPLVREAAAWALARPRRPLRPPDRSASAAGAPR
jgi:hypothetical protein